MKIILLKDVSKIGRKGEIKDISDGYAKNALFPKGLARIATLGVIKDWEDKKEKEKDQEEKRRKILDEIVSKLPKKEFVFNLKVGENGELFNSLHKGDITKRVVEEIKNSFGSLFDVHIDMKPIKVLGEIKVPIRIGGGEYIKKLDININIKSE